MNVLNYVSKSAKQIIDQHHTANQGLLHVNEKFDKAFAASAQFGRYILREYAPNGEQTENVWLLLNSNLGGDDDGLLLGWLRQTAETLETSFWFKVNHTKEFSLVQNPNIPDDKYDIGDCSVLLESVRSPHSIYKQKW